MVRRKHEKFVNGDREEEDPVAITDDDDEEANEDLSLKILEKALSRRGGVDASKETDLSDSGVVSTNGGKSKKKTKKTKLESTEEIPIEKKLVEEEEEEVEKSVEPKQGEASSNLVLKKLLRGARYFDPPDSGWVSCYSCGEQGHITVNCPTPMKRRKPCFICGSFEHGAKQCSKGHDCYICKKGGHRARDCPDKYKSGVKKALCLRCGDFGHDMILCKYEYSLDDLKDIQCYVCKSYGHLCCVEPGNSLSWTVSCFRCGQLGHTGLACGRHFDDGNENDSVVSSACFKCGGEGHLKRDCPNSSSLSFTGKSREVISMCYRCGEEGHFSRECPNASSIGTSQGRDSLSVCYKCNGEGHFARECPNMSSIGGTSQVRDSPSLCYKCDGEGHFARECPNSSQGSKRTRDDDQSTPSRKHRKKNKENSENNSTPNESNGKIKKKKKQKGEQSQSTPRKQKHRGGWITEDPEEDYFQRGKTRRPRSPTTPSSHSHRFPTTHTGHDHHRSPTRYGRNHRNHSSESRAHGHQEPYHHHHHHHHQQQPHYHHEEYRYAPTPSRYGPAYRYDEFARNYDRY